MSLLMEALKKAEEAKRKAGEAPAVTQEAVADKEPSLQPLDEPPTSKPTPSWPSLELTLDEPPPLPPESPSPPPSPAKPQPRQTTQTVTSPGSRTAEQDAAQNLFSAKQQPEKSSNGLWLFASLGLLAALLIAGYFWWQLQSPQQGLALKAPARPAAQTPSTPAAPVAAVSATSAPPAQPAPMLDKAQEPPTQSSDTEAAAPLSPQSEPPTQPAPRPVPLPSAAAASPSKGKETSVFSLPPAKPAAAKTQTTPAPKPTAPPTAAASPEPQDAAPLRFNRTVPKTNPTLDRAYDKLQEGRLDEAKKDYEQVLRSDGKNTDALLGLATIAQQRGQFERAYHYYSRALESDPSDPTAQAGVIHSRGQSNAETSESRLKTALSSQPNSSALLFALGNLYAGQERWGEAQQIFFQAYATEPDNPDFIFNLAISLDHLHQGKLAAQYYEMALAASELRPAAFNKEQARSRLLELRPQ